MKKIKVVHVYLGFYRDAGGENHSLALAEELDRERFSFEIVTLMPTTSTIGAAIQDTGCTIHQLELGIPRLNEPVRMTKTIYAIYKTFRSIKPDIVQTQSTFCNVWARLAAKLARVPVVIMTINFDEPKRRKLLQPFFGAMHRWLATSTDAYVCIAPHLVKEQLRPYEWSRAEIIPPFFDLNRFLAGRTDLPEIRALTDSACPLIGLVGRLEYNKGHTIAIAAMREIVNAVPGARLKIVGAGSLEKELRDQVVELGLSDNVEFAGHRTEICEIMSNMDLLLIPSFNEAFGLVVLESIAAGVPLVGSRSGAFPEILENGKYGTLVDPFDSKALADTAIDIIANPAPALAKLKKARETLLKRYTKEESVRQRANLYERLAGKI
ncbi:MAG: glycosyltransferase family 4 protein [Cyanobacteria bacterium P01_E01_bin.34]